MQRIHCESYESLAEYVYNDDRVGLPLPKGVRSVFCHCDNIAQLFRENEDADPYVLISAQSDFGPRYQSEHPVCLDMPKWINFLPGVVKFEEMGYQGLNLPPRCRLDSCDIEDKYSIKCYSFTRSTFPRIPINVVKWFCTNSDIDETVNLPFGAEAATLDKLHSAPKDQLIYYNCVAYSVERYNLFNLCKTLPHITLRHGISHEEFNQDLARHCMVICPISNGIDSYRVWQALYSGAVPVVQDCRTFAQFDLPIIRCDNLFQRIRDKDWLVDQYQKEVVKFEGALPELSLGYWKERIQSQLYCKE